MALSPLLVAAAALFLEPWPTGKTSRCLGENGGMEYGDYYSGLYGDYFRGLFPHSPKPQSPTKRQGEDFRFDQGSVKPLAFRLLRLLPERSLEALWTI